MVVRANADEIVKGGEVSVDPTLVNSVPYIYGWISATIEFGMLGSDGARMEQ